MAQDTKGSRTAVRIRAVAFAALREDGWHATTMRGIAERAGVSPGTIYLSMPSKEHLLLALYDDTVARIEARAIEGIAGVRPFAARLATALEITFEEIEPFHQVATEAIGQAIAAASPVNPFGEPSRASRERMLALFARIVEGSDLIADRELRRGLPELLWGLLMGGMLAWTHDRSRDQRRSRALLQQAVPMLDRAVRVTAVPLLRAQVRDLLALATAAKELSADDA